MTTSQSREVLLLVGVSYHLVGAAAAVVVGFGVDEEKGLIA